MPCSGCQRRKAAMIRTAKAVRGWLRQKTPKQAREAIRRRVLAREGSRDAV